jgi:lipid A 3-O-deacylase
MRHLAAAWGLAVALCCAVPASAQDPIQYITVNIGAADVFDDDTAAMGAVEWRSDFTQLILTPMLGGFVTTDGSVYGYGGVFVDIYLTDQLVARPSAAVGAYSKGDGKDLGGTLEFRTAIELAWQFTDRSRLGVELAHISNAGIDDHNPGTETLTVNYSLPLSSIF